MTELRTPAEAPHDRVRCGSRVALALLVVSLAAFTLNVRKYWPFLADDALIALRYAERLAGGHGLTWTHGPRVEGYTDLLWVLLVALAKLLGGDPIKTARALDFLGAVSAIVLVSVDPEALRLAVSRVLSGGLMLAFLAPLAVWAIGGLEQGFMAGVIVAALLFLSRALAEQGVGRRDVLAAGALLGALVLLRADGFVLVGAAGLGALIARGRPRRAGLVKLGKIFSVPVVLLLLQEAFRLGYYHALVPNTALVKVSLNKQRLLSGWYYVEGGYRPLWPLLVLALLALVAGSRRLRRERWIPAFCMTLAWSSYLVVVGGDIFPGWRLLLLALVPLAVVVAEATQAAASRWRYSGVLVAAVTLPVVLYSWKKQSANHKDKLAIAERWEFDGDSIGPALRGAFGRKKPLLAVDGAGALPYWSGLPALDMLGLNDRYIATHPPPHFGHGALAHDLGDGRYVWKRRPDIIAFDNAAGARNPRFLSGRQMVRMPAFRREYQIVRVRGTSGDRAVGELWFLREGGKLGVTRSPGRIDIPGYFFAGGNAVASPDRSGQLVVWAQASHPATLPGFPIPAGTWRLKVDPPSSHVAVGFRCNRVSAEATGVTAPPSIQLARRTRVDIVVGPVGPRAVLLTHASLVRADKASYRCARGSQGWLDVPLGQLSHVQGEGSPWDGPGSVVFRSPGVRVLLPGISHPSAIELGVDYNDLYEVDLMRGTETVASLRIRPRANGVGLALHRLGVPDDARSAGFDRIEIRPVRGDGKYSLGFLLLIDPFAGRRGALPGGPVTAGSVTRPARAKTVGVD